MRLNDLALEVLSLAFGLIVIGYASTFPAIPGQAYGPGLFPTLIGAGMAITGLSLVANGIRSEGKVPLFHLLDWQRSGRAVINALLLIGATLLYLFVVERLGFILTTFLILVVTLTRFHGRPVLALVISGIIAPTLQHIFADLLLVPLPWSVLQPIAW